MELLEREPYLHELHRLLRDATDRRGRVLFLGGEAGVGKTSLVEAFFQQVEPEVEAVRSSCDALSTPGPLSSVRVHASALGLTFEPHRRQGLGRDDLFHAMLEAIERRDAPILMVGEDAHWSDDASLDLVRFIGRRIESLPLLLIVTYRDDEVGAYHPLQRILGDLATAPGYRRMSLAPLSEASVRVLAGGSGIDPSALHQQTGGNPFYVTEILAAGGEVLPASVSDAVLARASRLSSDARFVLGTAAVLGATIDPVMLSGMAGPALDEVEECMASGLLRSEGDLLVFRHQLTRDAIYASLIPPRRRLLHERALALLRERPDREKHLAVLAHHAELAGDRDATLEFAIAAAGQAQALRSHREAAQQFARALRHAEPLPDAERAELFESWSYECYLTNQMDDAIEGRRSALAIWQEVGNPIKEGENHRWLSRVHWFAGHSDDAETAAQAALAILEPLRPGPQLAWAYSNLSQLRMLAYDDAGAVAWGERAIALAEQLEEREILVHALGNVGAARARMPATSDDGCMQLERSLQLALEGGFADHAARAWAMLAIAAIERLELTASIRHLADGIAYTTEHDQDSMRDYLIAWRAALNLYQGNWSQAEADCRTVLDKPQTTPLSRIVALTALGRLRARRGEPDAMGALDEAHALALPTGEMQRLGPVHAARTEAAWLVGDDARFADAIATLRTLADRPLTAWLRGEIHWWLTVAGAGPLPGGPMIEPYSLQIAGAWAAAADAWDAVGCPYKAARARLASDDETTLRSALNVFEQLGATATAAKTLQRLREINSARLHRGPARSTRSHPAGLTSREAEILSLISAGHTNREIAERLYVSPKTVEHHVTAILGKLGVPSRRDAARTAAELDSRRPASQREPA